MEIKKKQTPKTIPVNIGFEIYSRARYTNIFFKATTFQGVNGS